MFHDVLIGSTIVLRLIRSIGWLCSTVAIIVYYGGMLKNAWLEFQHPGQKCAISLPKWLKAGQPAIFNCDLQVLQYFTAKKHITKSFYAEDLLRKFIEISRFSTFFDGAARSEVTPESLVLVDPKGRVVGDGAATRTSPG